jgi:hypothetical protein
MFSSASHSQ